MGLNSWERAQTVLLFLRLGSWIPLKPGDFGISDLDKIATSTLGGGLDTLGVCWLILASCMCVDGFYC